MKTKLLIALCSLGIVLLTTCSSEEKNQLPKNSSEMSEDEFVSLLKFNDLSSIVTRGNPTIPPGNKTKGILSARIARKSKNCTKGFGLCDFKLFPKSTSITEIERTISPDEYLFEITLDEDSIYEVKLLLAQPLPENISPELASLKIDDDIYWIKDETTMAEINKIITESTNSNVLTIESQTGLFSATAYKIEAEVIKYNPNLGENGGYSVKLINTTN